ncbi:MAG: Ig-like domain-containing protein [Acholeplasmatales bacterium]|jgi:uncharacterized protein YjdB|nr:Ig-like domain-containing protein [Acholeplasmatales bacterium]
MKAKIIKLVILLVTFTSLLVIGFTNPKVSILNEINALNYNEEYQLEYSTIFSFKKDVTFSSSDTNILMINNSGFITAIRGGEVEITATILNYSYSFKCTVYSEPKSILITGQNNIYLFEETTLSATVYPLTSKQVYTFSSENDSIATIDTHGVVKGLKSGTVEIIARVLNTNIENSFTLNVNYYSPEEIIVTNMPKDPLTVGDSFQLEAYINPNLARQDFNFSTTNSRIVDITSSGYITALDEGETDVYIRSIDNLEIFTKVHIVVIYAPLISISILGAPLPSVAKPGDSFDLVIIPNPYNSSENVIWSTSDTSIGEISGSGILKIKKYGEFNVVAVSVYDNEIVESIFINTRDGINIITDIDSPFLVGSNKLLEFEVYPLSRGSNVILTSSDPSILVISNLILIPLKKGSVDITLSLVEDPLITLSFIIYVDYPLPTSIEIINIPNSYTLSPNDIVLLHTLVYPISSLQEFYYSSSDETIFEINNLGYLICHSYGEATITVYSNINNNIKATYQISTKLLTDYFDNLMSELKDNYTLDIYSNINSLPSSSYKVTNISLESDILSYVRNGITNNYYLLENATYTGSLKLKAFTDTFYSYAEFKDRYYLTNYSFSSQNETSNSLNLIGDYSIFSGYSNDSIISLKFAYTNNKYYFIAEGISNTIYFLFSEIGLTEYYKYSLNYYQELVESVYGILGDKNDIINLLNYLSVDSNIYNNFLLPDNYYLFQIDINQNSKLEPILLSTNSTIFTLRVFTINSTEYINYLLLNGSTETNPYYVIHTFLNTDFLTVTVESLWIFGIDITLSTNKVLPTIWPGDTIDGVIMLNPSKYSGLIIPDLTLDTTCYYYVFYSWSSFEIYIYPSSNDLDLRDSLTNKFLEIGYLQILTERGYELQDETRKFGINISNINNGSMGYLISIGKSLLELSTIYPKTELENEFGEEALNIPDVTSGNAYLYEQILNSNFNRSLIIASTSSSESRDTLIAEYEMLLLSNGFQISFKDPVNVITIRPKSYIKQNIQITVSSYSYFSVGIYIYAKQNNPAPLSSWPYQELIDSNIPEDFVILLPSLPGDNFYVLKTQDDLKSYSSVNDTVIYSPNFDIYSYNLLLEANGFISIDSYFYKHPSFSQYKIYFLTLEDNSKFLVIVLDFNTILTSWTSLARLLTNYFNGYYNTNTIIGINNLPEIPFGSESYANIIVNNSNIVIVTISNIDVTLYDLWITNLLSVGFVFYNSPFFGQYYRITNKYFIYSTGLGDYNLDIVPGNNSLNTINFEVRI